MICLRLNPFLIDSEISKSAILKLSFLSLKEQDPPLLLSHGVSLLQHTRIKCVDHYQTSAEPDCIFRCVGPRRHLKVAGHQPSSTGVTQPCSRSLSDSLFYF
ncbi:hypothetical protein CHARACLAT_023782 [Characodon lateralis]|uniref:Uncharacterized protein n=1 Tax=Characodon lateralis TaxID=208331 RepID=A0ABU7DN40_9TELE|nr:hypothetical protein [Characodon lateralis]